MPVNFISRNHYDVRFLEIQDIDKNLSTESYIDSQIHSIYPGNNGAYEWRYRLFDDSVALIVFIKKDKLSEYEGTKPIIPVFLLCSMKKDLKPATVYIHQYDCVEKIIFENQKPVRSVMMPITSVTDTDYKTGSWFALASFTAKTISPGNLIKLPRLGDRYRFKKISSSNSFSFRSFYIILILILAFTAGFSFRYSRLLKNEISEYKKLQAQVLRLTNTKTRTENNINILRDRIKSTSMEAPGEPYTLLEALYSFVGGIIEIQRITIQNDSFSIECIGSDPIKVSDILSKTTAFSDVSIQRIQDSDGKFKFSISGNFNG